MNRSPRYLSILAQAQLIPQQLALEQARGAREAQQTNAWLSAVGPLLQGAAGAVNGYEKSVTDQAARAAEGEVAARAYDVGDKLTGPLNEGVTERPYLETPAELARKGAAPTREDPLDFIGNRARASAREAAQSRIAGGIAKNRRELEERDYSRGIQRETLDIAGANKKRDDDRANEAIAEKKKQTLYKRLEDTLRPIVDDELMDDASGKGIYTSDARIMMGSLADKTGLSSEEVEGVYRRVVDERMEARRKADLEERRTKSDEEKARAAIVAAGLKPPPEGVRNDNDNIDTTLRNIDDTLQLLDENEAGVGPIVGQLTGNKTFSAIADKLLGTQLEPLGAQLRVVNQLYLTAANGGRLTDTDARDLKSASLSMDGSPSSLRRFLRMFRAALLRRQAELARLYPNGVPPDARKPPPPAAVPRSVPKQLDEDDEKFFKP